MHIRTRSAVVVAAAGLLAVAIPAGGASAATPAPSLQPPALTFVPPKVGAISVDIAPTIINGKVTNPGLHVLMPGVSLPPMTLTLPPINWPH
jgi:hypothetical protein